MDHFRMSSTVIHSPEDSATVRQWRRAVCFFYAAITFTLVIVWGVQQLGKQEDEAQIASSATPSPTVKVVRGDRTPQ
jgi:negative regulator of sigma E activity